MKKFEKDLISISTSMSNLAEKIKKLVEAIENEAGLAKPATKKAAKKRRTANEKDAKRKKVAPESSKSTVKSDVGNLLETIFELVGSSEDGITVAEIKDKTGFAPRQVSNALYKLTKKGQIKTIRRGVYATKKA